MGWAVAVVVVASSALLAEQAKPAVDLPASPRGLAAMQAGDAWITIDYGRPLLRGRQNIFGSGADYGKLVNGDAVIWRAGANETTRLTTQTPLVFGTTTIDPGVYNVFVDLKPGAWTFVLSTQPVQPKYDPNEKVLLYGAYNYDPAFDVLRVPMRVSEAPASVEQFTISFVNVAAGRGSIAMAWDRTGAMVDFQIR